MNNKKTIISLAAVIAVVAGVIGFAAMNKKADTSTVSDTSATPVTNTTTDSTGSPQGPVADKPSTTPSTTKTTTEYKDGTYTATGAYNSPGGPDNLGVTVTIKNDTVAAVSVVPMAHDRESSHYQSLFISGYQSLVVGKKVDSVHLDAVSGSSLTPIGFNDAFAQIKTQAKA